MAKRKPHRANRSTPKASAPSLPPLLRAGLIEAEELLDDQKWLEAADLLEDLNLRYPRRALVLSLLLIALQELQIPTRCLPVAEQLFKVTPDDTELTLYLASLYMEQGYLALSLPLLQRFLDRAPDHERAPSASELLEETKVSLREQGARIGLEGDDIIELATLHEQTRRLVEQGEYADARKAARKLLVRRPQFAPALNNIAQSYYAEGHLDQAISTTREVLSFEPANIHALSNLVRYAVLSGDDDTARRSAEQLRTSSAGATDRSYKIAEALSYMGDDAGVLAVVSQDRGQGTLMEASLGHLAAVASLRLGREEDARRLWEQALSVSPSLSVAQANLDDLARPVEERAGPWAFSVENWVPERAMLDLIGHVERIGQGSSQDALERQARAFLRRHPEMVPLVPILFDRGDPAARTFAFALAGMAHTPEMQAAVRDFALSRRGPDALRMQALQQSREEGLLPETARVWIKGEWRDLELRGYEIHDESLHSHSPEVARLVIEAVLLLQDRQAKAAEELLLQALVLEPDAPDIMNNLATAYGQQQRGREARLILERLHAQHPDYLFAAANLASMAARDGRIPEARALLEPFQSRTRLHRTEFASLSSAQIELALAEGDPESARIMFDMWEGIDPDHPLLDHFLGRIEDAAVPERRLSARPTGR